MIPIRTRLINECPPEAYEWAEKRLIEVQALLNEKPKFGQLRSHVFSQRDLIAERLRLRLFLGKNSETQNPELGQCNTKNNNNPHLKGAYTMQFEFEDPNTITFENVGSGELFVDMDGYLCQKSGEDSYSAWRIANRYGNPCGESVSFDDCDVVKKVLPRLKNVSF